MTTDFPSISTGLGKFTPSIWSRIGSTVLAHEDAKSQNLGLSQFKPSSVYGFYKITGTATSAKKFTGTPLRYTLTRQSYTTGATSGQMSFTDYAAYPTVYGLNLYEQGGALLGAGTKSTGTIVLPAGHRLASATSCTDGDITVETYGAIIQGFPIKNTDASSPSTINYLQVAFTWANVIDLCDCS